MDSDAGLLGQDSFYVQGVDIAGILCKTTCIYSLKCLMSDEDDTKLSVA